VGWTNGQIVELVNRTHSFYRWMGVGTHTCCRHAETSVVNDALAQQTPAVHAATASVVQPWNPMLLCI